MSLADLSAKIRDVLDVDSPVNNLPEILSSINAFVQQQRDAPEQSVLDGLKDDLESMYKAIDHTSPANVETFVAILCAFLPLSHPIYVITHWWDLVLRAALRDPRLSTKTLRQAKELTLHGLISDSIKATEFRKRIIEFYLDTYDESSGRDALEHATMSANEREIQQFWIHNLEDILEEFRVIRPEEYLTALNVFFTSREWRLRLVVLLGAVVRSSNFSVKEFTKHPILNSLLLSLMVDRSPTLLEIETVALATLLAQIAVYSPDTLKRILPSCYAILARIVCWKPGSTQSLERDDEYSDTSSQTHRPELDIDTSQAPRLRSNLDWQQLETTFKSISKPPSPLRLFRCLYWLYPCNTLAFLRDPIGYISHTNLESPFAEGWPDILDEDQIRTRSRVLLRLNVLHTDLLAHTAESELATHDRWAQWDVPRITMMATMLDVRNAALSWRRVPDDLYNPDMTQSTSEDLPSAQSMFSSDDTQTDRYRVTELRSTDFSFPDRPRVSVQDILATYHALKSGVEIDIVDPVPEWPHLLFPSTVAPQTVFNSTTSSPESSRKPFDEAIPPHVKEAISGLQRENLLLRNELNFELWLKRESTKQVGRLHQDRILVKGAEVERQGLHNKLREYKGQVQHLQDALAKEQTGAMATKSQHTDYSNRLQAKLKAEREEKRSWAQEKSELKKAYDDATAMLEAQGARLADAVTRVFALETQIKENGPKVQRLRDYEHKIEQFTQTQQLWDDDVRRYKKQALYLDELRSRYRKKLLLVESYEKANQELEETIISLKNRIVALESQTSLHRPAEPSERTYEMMEALRTQISSLTSERDALISKTDDLGDQIEDLNMTVDALRAGVHRLDGPADMAVGGVS